MLSLFLLTVGHRVPTWRCCHVISCHWMLSVLCHVTPNHTRKGIVDRHLKLEQHASKRKVQDKKQSKNAKNVATFLCWNDAILNFLFGQCFLKCDIADHEISAKFDIFSKTYVKFGVFASDKGALQPPIACTNGQFVTQQTYHTSSQPH